MQYATSTSLENKVALVTGAARGIGRACALALAEAGANVALGLRDIDADDGVVEEITEIGRRVLPLQLNVEKLSELRDASVKIKSTFGRLDILVNNAGVGPPNLIENVSEEDFDKTVNVNLKGTFFASQIFGKILVEQRSGKIINLSSQAGFIALDSESVYCMTKAGIAHLTKCFAAEWAKYNINVNAVAPTFIKTPGTMKWLEDETFRQHVLQKIKLGRVGIPKDVADAVLFLSSEAASMITGTTLMVDGGWTLG